MTGELRRVIGMKGAVLMGLGSILGTGVFVSLAVATELTGAAVLPALVLAAALAVTNGLASATLAARFPVSGGTYEYAYRTVGPNAGFTAGWLFLAAKSASAATAALGFAAYLLRLVPGLPAGALVPVALLTTAVATAVVAAGVQRSNQLNALLVTATVGGLLAFIGSCTWHLWTAPGPTAVAALSSASPAAPSADAFLRATALMFVAYTGYGRIATLGEEVTQPERTIPRAIVATLAVALLLYLGVAAVLVASGRTTFDAATGAPLEDVSRALLGSGAAT
jgi:APA family basic amino acid/polyamine antiporter